MVDLQLQDTVKVFKQVCLQLSSVLKQWSLQSTTSFPLESVPQLQHCCNVATALQFHLTQISLIQPKGLHLEFTHKCRGETDCEEKDWNLSRPDQGDFSIPIKAPCGAALEACLMDEEGNAVNGVEGMARVWLASETSLKKGTIPQQANSDIELVESFLVPHYQCQCCLENSERQADGVGTPSCQDPCCAKDKPFLLLSDRDGQGGPGVVIDVEMKNGVISLDNILLTKCGRRCKSKQLKSEAMQLLITLPLTSQVFFVASHTFKTITERALKAQKRKRKEMEYNAAELLRSPATQVPKISPIVVNPPCFGNVSASHSQYQQQQEQQQQVEQWGQDIYLQQRNDKDVNLCSNQNHLPLSPFILGPTQLDFNDSPEHLDINDANQIQMQQQMQQDQRDQGFVNWEHIQYQQQQTQVRVDIGEERVVIGGVAFGDNMPLAQTMNRKTSIAGSLKYVLGSLLNSGSGVQKNIQSDQEVEEQCVDGNQSVFNSFKSILFGGSKTMDSWSKFF